MTANLRTVLVPLPEGASIGDPLHLSADGVLLARSYYGSTGWGVLYVSGRGVPYAGRVTAHLMKRRVVEFTLPDHDCVLHGQRPEPLTESQTESLRIREMSAEDRERHELQLVLAPHVDRVGVGWSPLDLDVSLSELRAHAERVGVTIPALLTITLGDATTEPIASAKWAIRPQPPQIDTSAEGYGVDPDDRLITTDVIIDTLNAMGVSTVSLTPTNQTLGGPDGRGMLYSFTHGPNAEGQDDPFIRFAMPDAAARLEDLVPDTTTGATAFSIAVGGYHVGQFAYDAAAQELQITIPALLGQQPLGTFIVGQLPSVIERNRTDPVSVSVNGSRHLVPLLSHNYEALVPSQLTQGQLVQFWHLGPYPVTRHVFPDSIEDRPQDYNVYGAWKSAVGFVGFEAADFLSQRGQASMTNTVSLAYGPSDDPDGATFRQALWVPESTGDVLGLNVRPGVRKSYERGDDVTINGVPGKVWQSTSASSSFTFTTSLTFTFEQEYP